MRCVNVANILEEARRFGARIGVDGDRLRIVAPLPLPDALVMEFRARKAELLTLLEDFEERAAIMEFDGGLSKEEAEREAWTGTLARFGLPSVPRLH